jgi:Spy/CpxP family protein refolding chaperone
MRGKWFICLVLSLAVTACTGEALAQSFKWWQDDKFQDELALTTAQLTRPEEIFHTLQPTLNGQNEPLDKLEARLSKVINDPRSDEATMLQVSERVEAARGELSKSRTLLLFRMRRILTSDQDVKMKALHEQWVRDRRNRPSTSQKPPASGPQE